MIYLGAAEASPPVRHNKIGVFRNYLKVCSEFRKYIRSEVASGDVVVVSSAPPNTIGLHKEISHRGARSIYWLQDYYPDLLRGLWLYPDRIKAILDSIWKSRLLQWDLVVKIGENLGYHGSNAKVIRNWPTLPVRPRKNQGKTALYAGNLGYGHDVVAFIEECERLREKGFSICVRGDGPGIKRLPSWIDHHASFKDEEELQGALEAADLHLIVAHPAIQTAIFPSKFWNARATGNPLLPIGFSGSMLEEFNASLQADYERHLDTWVQSIRQIGAR